MRRILTWFLSTVAVVALLLGYKTSTGGAVLPTIGTVATAPSTTVPGTSSSTSGSTTGSMSGSTSSSTTGTSQTYAGSVAQTRWGPVQVQITVTGGKITAVTVPRYPSGTGRDQEINSYALPILTHETLTSQNANIDMVSGATVTSGGYVQSLQSALDQASQG
jgi:uncharacterized protein with FMN-binding domain